MDPGKRKCIIEWVGCMTGDTITSIRQLENGSHLVKIIEIIGKRYHGDLDDTESKLQFVMDFLNDCYDRSLSDLVDISPIILDQDEFEIGKLCLLLMNAMLLSDNNSVLINAVMELPNTIQFEIKNIMESLSSDLKHLSVILLNKLELSSASDDDSLDVNKPKSPIPHVFSNSSISPSDSVFPSPQGMWKIIAQQKQEDLRRLERCLLSEQNLRAELEVEIDDKNRLLLEKDVKLRECHLEVKQLQARIELLQSSSETEAFELQIKELESRLQEQSKLKFQLTKGEKENEQLYQEIEQLRQELEIAHRQNQEELRKHQFDIKNELEELNLLYLHAEQQLERERATKKQLELEAKQATDFWKERVSQLEEQLKFQASFSNCDAGENLNIFVNEKKEEDMDDENDRCEESETEPDVESDQLQNKPTCVSQKLEQMAQLHRSEVEKLQIESEEKSQTLVNEFQKIQNELITKEDLIKQHEVSLTDLTTKNSILENERLSLQEVIEELNKKNENLLIKSTKLQDSNDHIQHNLNLREETIRTLQTSSEVMKNELFCKDKLLQQRSQKYSLKLHKENERIKKLIDENKLLQKQYGETRELLSKFEEQCKISEKSISRNEFEKILLEKDLCQTQEFVNELPYAKRRNNENFVTMPILKSPHIQRSNEDYIKFFDIVKRIASVQTENRFLFQQLKNMQDFLKLFLSDSLIAKEIVMFRKDITSYDLDHLIKQHEHSVNALSDLEEIERALRSENEILCLDIKKTCESLNLQHHQIIATLNEVKRENLKLLNKNDLLRKELEENQQHFQKEKDAQEHCQQQLLQMHDKHMLEQIEQQQKIFELEKQNWLNTMEIQQNLLFENEKQRLVFESEKDQLLKELQEAKMVIKQKVVSQEEKDCLLNENVILREQLIQMSQQLNEQHNLEVQQYHIKIKELKEIINVQEVTFKEKLELETKLFKESEIALQQVFENRLKEQTLRLEYLSQSTTSELQGSNNVNCEEQFQNKSFEVKHQEKLLKNDTVYKELYQRYKELEKKYELQDLLTSFSSELISVKQNYLKKQALVHDVTASSVLHGGSIDKTKDNTISTCQTLVSTRDATCQGDIDLCKTQLSPVSCTKQRFRADSESANSEYISTRSYSELGLQRSNSMILLSSPHMTSDSNGRQLPAGSGRLFMCEDEPLIGDYNWNRIKELSQRKTGAFSSLNSLCSQSSKEMEDGGISFEQVVNQPLTNRKRKQEDALSEKKNSIVSSKLNSSRRKVKTGGTVYQKPGPPTPGKNAQVKANRPIRTPNSVKRLFTPLNSKSSKETTSNSLPKTSLSFPASWTPHSKKSFKNGKEPIETIKVQEIAENNKNPPRNPLRIKNIAKKNN